MMSSLIFVISIRYLVLIWPVSDLTSLWSICSLCLWCVWPLVLIWCVYSVCSMSDLYLISCSDLFLIGLICFKCFSLMWCLSDWSDLSAESLCRRRRIWVKRLGEWSQVCRICRSCRLKSSCSPPRWLLSSPPPRPLPRPTDAVFSTVSFHLSFSVYRSPAFTKLTVMILISSFWFSSSCLSCSWAFLSSKTLST